MKTYLASLLLLLSSSAFAQSELKWAYEDANNDSVFNYSVVNNNFATTNQWANIPMSTDAYQGTKSLSLKYLNKDTNDGGTFIQAFGFAIIPTSYAGVGLEPNSNDEYLAGKDLSTYNTLEFYVKGQDGANRSNLNVWLRSPNGHGSVQVPLKNYVTVDNTWKKVTIPVQTFQFAQPNPNAFQLFNVHAVGFYVNQDANNVPFEIKVDNIRFVKNGTTPAPLKRAWWTRDANLNGEYNYSLTSFTNGAAVSTSNQWGDVAIRDYMTGPMGNSPIPAVDMIFHSNAYGTAEAVLTTSKQDASGVEPIDFADRDAGKAINAISTLKFAAPGINAGVYVKLVDTQGRSSKSVSINQYRSSYGRYTFDFNIPVSALLVPGFDLSNVRSVNFFVDRSTPAGDYPLKVINLRFDM